MDLQHLPPDVTAASSELSTKLVNMKWHEAMALVVGRRGGTTCGQS